MAGIEARRDRGTRRKRRAGVRALALSVPAALVLGGCTVEVVPFPGGFYATSVSPPPVYYRPAAVWPSPYYSPPPPYSVVQGYNDARPSPPPPSPPVESDEDTADNTPAPPMPAPASAPTQGSGARGWWRLGGILW